jgi:C_GCAxxG_C_C family probable redox protein
MTTVLHCSKEDMIAIADRMFNAEGRCCGEAVLAAGCAALGVVGNEIIPAAALGFGGGMGLTGRVCGSFSGAIIAIGIATGQSVADYSARKGETFGTVATFLQTCTDKWQSADCKAICGLDLTTPEGLDKLINGGVKDKICAAVVRETAGMLHDELHRIKSSKR